MTKSAPLSMTCITPGVSDRWTCPACYTDLDARRAGTVICPDCGHSVILTLDHEPVCVSEVIIDAEG